MCRPVLFVWSWGWESCQHLPVEPWVGATGTSTGNALIARLTCESSIFPSVTKDTPTWIFLLTSHHPKNCRQMFFSLVLCKNILKTATLPFSFTYFFFPTVNTFDCFYPLTESFVYFFHRFAEGSHLFLDHSYLALWHLSFVIQFCLFKAISP